MSIEHNPDSQRYKASEHPSTGQGFDPADEKYTSCCCHAKTFTFVFGVVELFIICFLLFTVLPDYHQKICYSDKPKISSTDSSTTNTTTDFSNATTLGILLKSSTKETAGSSQAITETTPTTAKKLSKRQDVTIKSENVEKTVAQTTISPINPSEVTVSTMVYTVEPEISTTQNPNNKELPNHLKVLKVVICTFPMVWLGWAILQIIFLSIMFYGLRRQKWQFIIPHIAIRIWCAITLVFLIGMIFYMLVFPSQRPAHVYTNNLATALVFFLLVGWWLGVQLKGEIRCCQFIKLSMETGYSVTNPRPIHDSESGVQAANKDANKYQNQGNNKDDSRDKENQNPVFYHNGSSNDLQEINNRTQSAPDMEKKNDEYDKIETNFNKYNTNTINKNSSSTKVNLPPLRHVYQK